MWVPSTRGIWDLTPSWRAKVPKKFNSLCLPSEIQIGAFQSQHPIHGGAGCTDGILPLSSTAAQSHILPLSSPLILTASTVRSFPWRGASHGPALSIFLSATRTLAPCWLAVWIPHPSFQSSELILYHLLSVPAPSTPPPCPVLLPPVWCIFLPYLHTYKDLYSHIPIPNLNLGLPNASHFALYQICSLLSCAK